MSKNKKNSTNQSFDVDQACHHLRSALNNFRESFEMLQEPDPDIIGAKTVFASAEKRILELIDILSAEHCGH